MKGENELKGADLTFTALNLLRGIEGKDWEHYRFDLRTWELKGYIYAKNGGSMPGPMARI